MPRNEDHVAAPTPTPIVCPGAVRQRDPSIFNGTDDQDVEDWLVSYERVSTHNNWDDRIKLNNVIFYLAGVANLWFRNHEADLTTWSQFTTSFTEVFGRPAVRKLRAEQRLRERAQQSGENFTSYIEDVVDLCKRVDSAMTEADKIKHILKGIDDDAFQMLLAKNPQTVADVVSLCQSFDELRKQRAFTRRPVAQDQSVSSLAADDVKGNLFLQIQQFVREEVARQLSLVHGALEPQSDLTPAIRHAIQQQVADALPSARQSYSLIHSGPYAERMQQAPATATPAYADAVHSMPMAAATPYDAVPLSYAEVARPSQQSPAFIQFTRPVRPPVRSGPQLANPWRTPDNRPICFSCGVPGHVARYCRRNMMGSRASSSAYSYLPSQPNQQQGTAYVPVPSVPSDRRDLGSRRSQSPRRRSLSPMRRRPAPPDTEN